MIKWILLFLLLAILSAAIWIFGPPLGFSTTLARAILIAVIWVPVLGVIIWRQIRAVRSASAIEKALANQAADHARNVAPDRREEIDALGGEMLRAIAALKRSRLGRGKRGQAALYALPWYMIVGPPAAGKSTALLASGLNFPYTPSSGKGLRGVGGTRNCDWWFTQQAILLDTAGRYMTEDEDREEWLAFLAFLRKYRSKKPLNGILVAASLPELLDEATNIEEVAGRLRSRVDEVMEKLGIVLPAYVLFTKCDLLAGFVEFFGDLRKKETGQIWGATLPLDDERPPADAFGEEFDLLTHALDRRSMERLADDVSAAERPLVYQFPMQLRASRERLSQLVGELFQRNPYQDSPIFRGFYFTSGTQEGRPIDRVMGEMARAFGLRARVADAISERRSERKSYFLRDLFTQVIFPDQDLAGRGASLVQRHRRTEQLVAGVAGGLAGLVLLGGLVSSCRNGSLADDTARVAEQASAVPWSESDRTPEDFDRLERLRARMAELDEWTQSGPPLGYGFGMFVGRDLAPGTRDLYHAELRHALVEPALRELALRLAQIRYVPDRSADARGQDFATLKSYLMLSDPSHVDRPFLVRQLLPIWKDHLRRRRSLVADTVLVPHLETFVDHLARGSFPPLHRDALLVEQARSVLRRTPEGDAELASIIAEAQRRLQPAELRDAMEGHVSTAIESRERVPGCYTRAGWQQFVERELSSISGKADRDMWVLSDSGGGGDARRSALRDRYFQEYAAAWRKFLRGLSVRQPADQRQALTDLEELTQENPPLARILRYVADQVSIPEPEAAAADPSTYDKLKAKISGDKPAAAAAPHYVAPLDGPFAKLRDFVGAPGAKDAPISQYLTELAKLRDALRDAVETGGDPAKVNDEARAASDLTKKLLLETLDEPNRALIRGLLEAPIASVSSSVVKGSGESLSTAWREEVFDVYRKTVQGRYPFAPKGADASLADVTEFLKPGGVLWAHYDSKLAKLVPRQGTHFHPAKPYDRIFGGAFLHCLESGAAWSDALFPSGAQKAQVDFEVRPQGVASGVGEVELEIDGQKRVYRNGPEERWPFKWPGEGKHGVRLVLRGRTGELGRLEIPGDWALLRFLDAGKLTSAGDGLLKYEWTVGKMGGGIHVPLVLKPSRAANPLHQRPGFNCPAGVR
jgi:type VI secretion system protein ImpL